MQPQTPPSTRRPGRPSTVDRFWIPDELYNLLEPIGFFDNLHDPGDVGSVLPDASRFEFVHRLRATVRRFIVLTKGRKASFVEILGKSYKSFERYLLGTAVKNTTLDALSNATGVPSSWLLSGVVPQNSPVAASDLRSRISARAFLTEHVGEFTLVPRYDVAASAGAGRLIVSEEVAEMMPFRQDWLRNLGIPPLRAGLMTADGDSMEPTIPDRALMLVNLADQMLRHGGIFVLVRHDSLIVKRVEILNHRISLISDNPIYEREHILNDEIDQLHVAGRVRWVARAI